MTTLSNTKQKAKKKARDLETDAMIAVLMFWRHGKLLGQLNIDPFDLLSQWVGMEKYKDVLNNFDSFVSANREYSLSADYIDSLICKIFAMCDYLCHCGDPELEYAGRYVRERWLEAVGME
jgi:hypothetical protein